MPDSQLYPYNINQIKNVVVHVSWKVFISVNFYIFFTEVTFSEKAQQKTVSINKNVHI